MLLSRIKDFWEEAKAFFKYSETIFLARLTTLTGFITIMAGNMDWSPLLTMDFSTGFSKHQVIGLGLVMVIKGIIDELARRRGMK